MNTGKLLSVMAEKRVSQRALAKEIGISATNMNAKINGKFSFDTEEVIKICNVLGIDNAEDKVKIFLTRAS